MELELNNRPAIRLGPSSVAKIMRTLLSGPCNLYQLQLASGLSPNTIYGFIRALRKEDMVHISEWQKDSSGRDSVRVFKLGQGKDAQRSRKSKAQIAKECRQRKREAKLWSMQDDHGIDGPPHTVEEFSTDL